MSAPNASLAKLRGAIHAEAARTGLDDDTRRDLMERVTGKRSTTSMSLGELGRVLDEIKARAPAKRFTSLPAQANKCRALWLALYNLGEVKNPRDEAMEAAIKRVTGVAFIHWNRPDDLRRAIEALKSWCERVGYYEPDTKNPGDLVPVDRHGARIEAAPGVVYRIGLMRAQWARLAALGAVVRADPAALDVWADNRRHGAGLPRLAGLYLWRVAELDDLVKALGRWIRRLKAKSAA